MLRRTSLEACYSLQFVTSGLVPEAGPRRAGINLYKLVNIDRRIRWSSIATSCVRYWSHDRDCYLLYPFDWWWPFPLLLVLSEFPVLPDHRSDDLSKPITWFWQVTVQGITHPVVRLDIVSNALDMSTVTRMVHWSSLRWFSSFWICSSPGLKSFLRPILFVRAPDCASLGSVSALWMGC